jgi:manganese/iron transport system ATP-binding protein
MNAPATAGSQTVAKTGLDVHDVSVIYRNGNKALDGASFSVPKGSITALVGINGSGKSTLFKSLMGFVPLASGEISIMGLGVNAGAQAQSGGLCAAGRGGRLVVSRCWSRTWS